MRISRDIISTTAPSRPPYCLGDLFVRTSRTRAGRAAVRFRAAASDAFFARAERSSGVMVSRLRLPPIFPPFRPSSLMISESSAFLSLSMHPS